MADALTEILFNALGGAQKPDFKAGDPYAEPQQFVESALTTPILKYAIAPDKGGYGTGELMGAALISGLLGGGLGGLSKDYQSEQQSLYKNALLSAALKEPYGSTEGLDPSLFDVANQNADLFRVMEGLQNKQLAKAAGAEREKSIIDAIAKNPWAADKVVGAIAKYTGESKPAIQGGLPQTDDPTAKDLVAPVAKPNRGPEGTILDDMQRETEKLMESGVYTPAQASEAVSTAYKGKREELSKQYERIQESAKAGQELRTLADQMEYYLGKSGNTGWGGDAAQWFAGMAGLVSPGQKDKYSAGQQLESLGTEVIKSTGKVLKGPMSDSDIRLLLRAGPRLANEESANEEIVARWRYVGNLQDKYADFMRQAQNAGMPASEAEKGWGDLVKANPYLIRNQAGQLVPNVAWMKALSGEPNVGGGDAPQQSAKPQPNNYKTGPEYLQAYRAWEASQ